MGLQYVIQPFLACSSHPVSSDISLPDINVPSVVPATPAPQTELTVPSGRVIPKTPKTPGKPRKKFSNSKTPRFPKSPSKKGSLKDAFLRSTGPKIRLPISCVSCRDAKKPVSTSSFFPLFLNRCLSRIFLSAIASTNSGAGVVSVIMSAATGLRPGVVSS